MAKKGYNLLTTKQQAQFDAIINEAKTFQSEGKLMFKDLQRESKKRGGEGLGPMPPEFTQDVKKSLLKFLANQKTQKDVNDGLSRAKKEASDFRKRLNQEYTQIRKRAGFSPERNIGKASGGKIYSKTTIRKVPITD